MTNVETRKRLAHLSRKYGGLSLLWGLSGELVDCATPDDLGVNGSRYVPISRAVALAVSMATRFGGLPRLRELLESGQLESATEIMCECSRGPMPLTGPVDVVHVHVTEGRDIDGPYRHGVLSHCVMLADFDSLDQALEYVKVRGLELDKACSCAHVARSA
jgi:hypothetical protein